MILAISLEQTEEIVYTSKVATFEFENSAMDFARGKDHIMLIDCDSCRVIKGANVDVGEEI